MSVLPIMFSTDMVRAILDGQKTVTRRAMKPQPVHNNGFWKLGGAGWSDRMKSITPIPCHSLYNRMPYKPGDILYVRETWARLRRSDGSERFVYKASDTYPFGESGYIVKFRWHPSIHMPKEAARIFLRVTDVRVERLQEINAEGILAEGLTTGAAWVGDMEIATKEFAILWNSIIKPADLNRCGWEANPWVWVIEFERCKKQEKEGGRINGL